MLNDAAAWGRDLHLIGAFWNTFAVFTLLFFILPLGFLFLPPCLPFWFTPPTCHHTTLAGAFFRFILGYLFCFSARVLRFAFSSSVFLFTAHHCCVSTERTPPAITYYLPVHNAYLCTCQPLGFPLPFYSGFGRFNFVTTFLIIPYDLGFCRCAYSPDIIVFPTCRKRTRTNRHGKTTFCRYARFGTMRSPLHGTPPLLPSCGSAHARLAANFTLYRRRRAWRFQFCPSA